MRQEFAHFQGGHQVYEYQINQWIKQVLDGLKSGALHRSISSGDTCVIGLKFDTEIQVFVCNDSGRSVIRFCTLPGYEDSMENVWYSRPVSVNRPD